MKHRRHLGLALSLGLLLASCGADRGLFLAAKHHEEGSATYRISLDYPSFPGQSPLEGRIHGLVDESIAVFKGESAENLAAWEATATEADRKAGRPRHELLLRWRQAMLGPDQVSLLLERYQWTGGANGRTDLFSINYDLRSRRFVTLAEVLGNPGGDWLVRLAGLCRGELLGRFAAQGGFLDFVEEGTRPVESNFDCFTFDENRLTIHFRKYQVAPGSAGLPEVVLIRDSALAGP